MGALSVVRQGRRAVRRWATPGCRAFVACMVGLAATAAPVPAAPVAAAQPGGFVVRYNGTLRLSNPPAPVGTVITVVAIPRWPDVTVCGTGTVTDSVGSYTLDVRPVAPECVRRTGADPVPEHIFLVGGENVGVTRFSGSLATPAGLGQVVRRDLRGTLVGGQPVDNGGEARPVVVRYFGVLRGGNVPAPVGTVITVVPGAAGAARVTCGSGAVLDEVGTYWLDIAPLTPGCVRENGNMPVPEHLFLVNDENVGVTRFSGSLASPAGLGNTVQRDLRGAAPFPPPPAPVPGPNPPPPDPEPPSDGSGSLGHSTSDRS